MTGPSPDADLDNTLGLNQLPPAPVTNDHRARASLLMPDDGPAYTYFTEQIAQAIADAEQRGAARVLTERATAGTLPRSSHDPTHRPPYGTRRRHHPPRVVRLSLDKHGCPG